MRQNVYQMTRAQYACLYASMTLDWRRAFGDPHLPIVAVQLGPYIIDSTTLCCRLGALRFAQSDTLPEGGPLASALASTALLERKASRNASSKASLGRDDVARTVAAGGTPSGIHIANSALVPTYDLGSAHYPPPRSMGLFHWWALASLASLFHASPRPHLPYPLALCVCGRWRHQKNKSEVGRRIALQLEHLFMPTQQLQSPREHHRVSTYVRYEPSGRRPTLVAPMAAHPPADAEAVEWSGPVVRSVRNVQVNQALRPDAGPDTAPADPQDGMNRNVTHAGVAIEFEHAAGLALRPSQGCLHCCSDTKLTRHAFALFQIYVAVDHPLGSGAGHPDWWDAFGRVVPSKAMDRANGAEGGGGGGGGGGTSERMLLITPSERMLGLLAAGARLIAVRYGVLDVPQCALYNSAGLPALPFEFAVGYERGSTPGAPSRAL